MEREGAPGAAGRALDLEAAGRALRDVLRLARDLRGDRETLAEELIGPLVTELGLSAATLAMAEERAGTLVLRPVAAAGNHAPLTKHLAPAGLDAMAETAQVFADKRPVYEDSAHGTTPQRAGAGVGRWRDGLATEAYCLLPLLSRGEALGVLGLEWTEPGAFGLHERIALEALADAVALALAAYPTDTADAGTPPGAGAEDAESAEDTPGAPVVVSAAVAAPAPGPARAFDIDASGVVLLAASGADLTPPPAIRLSVGSDPDTDTWWDVVQFTPGRIAFALCVGDAAANAQHVHARGDALKHAFRAYAAQGLASAEVLRLCGDAFLRSAPREPVALLAGELVPASRALAFAAAGEASLSIEGRDGRSSARSWGAAPFTACSAPAPEERVAILLPGDRARVRLACGAEGASIELTLDLTGGVASAIADGAPEESRTPPPAAAQPGVSGPALVIMPDDRPQPRVVPPTTDPPLVSG